MVSNALRVAALLLCLFPCTAMAEIIAEGTYRGTYRVDHWQQPRFNFLFVHPRLHDPKVLKSDYLLSPHIILGDSRRDDDTLKRRRLGPPRTFPTEAL